MREFTLEIVECPGCANPAEAVDRFALESTDGPIDHAIVLCVLRHRVTVLVERRRSMERCDGGPSTAPSSLHGEQGRLVEVARILRHGIEPGLESHWDTPVPAQAGPERLLLGDPRYRGQRHG